MEKSGKIIISFKNGKDAIFGVNSHDDFVKLVEEMSKLLTSWVYLGKNSVLRVSEIVSVHYMSNEDYTES